MKYKSLVIFFLSLFILAFFVNPNLPYEQDQGSKAAKINVMVRTNTVLQPTATENIYSDAKFSFYYILSAGLYQFLDCDVIPFMNYLSAIMGAVFFTGLSLLLKRVLDFDPVSSWFIFINMPILFTTFLYGNEVAFSITFFTLSLLIHSIKFKGSWLASVLLLSLSILSRPDILLLVPFWVGWMIVFHLEGLPLKEKAFTIFKYGAVTIVFILVYFLLFIHSFKFGKLSFPFNTNIKLFLSYLTYPFNLSLILLSGLGFIFIVQRKRKLAVILLLLILPFVFYAGNLSSPKYIISLSFLYGITAAYFLYLQKKWVKVMAMASVILWYFISLSPYGIFYFGQGAGIYVPTADGAVPTGSYIWFYNNSRNGFYQQKYRSEIESFKKAMTYIDANPEKHEVIVGSFNLHFANLELSQSDHYNEIRQWMLQNISVDKFPAEGKSSFILLQRTYLSINKMDLQIKERMTTYLRSGKVRAVYEENSPFPSIIEVGENIPSGSNIELGERILFATQYYRNNGFLAYDLPYEAYWPTYWVNLNVSAEGKGKNKVLYSDQHWSAYEGPTQTGQAWMLELPSYFLSETDPNRVASKK